MTTPERRRRFAVLAVVLAVAVLMGWGECIEYRRKRFVLREIDRLRHELELERQAPPVEPR